MKLFLNILFDAFMAIASMATVIGLVWFLGVASTSMGQ